MGGYHLIKCKGERDLTKENLPCLIIPLPLVPLSLYQILEDKKTFPSNLNKYKPLRDALSHNGPIHERTLRSIEKEFGQNYFVFNEKGFDPDSPTNIQNLRREAWKFMDEMWKQYGI